MQGNLIGTDLAGRTAVQNLQSGIRIDDSSDNQIGGLVPGARNVISGNDAQGVLLTGQDSRNNSIQGNFIGTDINGAARLSNGSAGIGLLGAQANTIGGQTSDARNLISANNDAGIFLYGVGTAWNTIQGNFIGTDQSGTRALNNLYEGVYLNGAFTNSIGGDVAGAGNLISGGNNRGLYLTNASWNRIQGNLIGTAADGISPLGNLNHAIEIYRNADHNLIGGAGPWEGNRIAFTQVYTGVRIRDGNIGNLVLGNTIYSNTALGIDLGGAGVAVNDPCDADSGGNQLQNYPVLTSAVSGKRTRIEGNLNSVANRTYTLEFFASPSCDALGSGEGQIVLGDITVTTGPLCVSPFSTTLPVSVPPGYWITATATDPDNNTSEFSACVPVVTVPEPAITFSAGGTASISWPNTVPGLILLETDSLTPPVQWTPVPTLPIPNDGQLVVPIGLIDGSRFFQLSLP